MKALIASSHQPRYHMLNTTPRESTSKKRTCTGYRKPLSLILSHPLRIVAGRHDRMFGNQRLPNGNALNVVRHRVSIKGTQGPYAVSRGLRVGDIARKRSGVARDVGDGAGRQRGNVLDDRLASPGARWVENDQVGADFLSDQRFQRTLDLASTQLDLGTLPQVALGIHDGLGVRLDGQDGSGRPHGVSKCQGEQAYPGVEIQRPFTRLWCQLPAHVRDKGGCGLRMDLPETSR